MLPPVHQRLLSATGSLSALPLPLLLHALWEGRHSALLTLGAADGRQKRLLLRDGALQACETNVSAESLPAYLVARGVLDAAFARRVEEAALSAGVTPESVLLQHGVLDAATLEQHRQAVTAHRILDCFGPGWAGASYALSAAPQGPDGPRLSMLQLLLFGVMNFTPLEVIRAHLPEGTRLRRRIPPPPVVLSLKPTDREAGVLELLSTPLTAAEVAARSNLSAEEAARRLFSLAVLELVEEVARPVAAPSAVVQVVRFLRQDQPRLEVEEPAPPAGEAMPRPAAAPEPPPPPEDDITGIIPTHRLPPMPGADAAAPDITAVYTVPPSLTGADAGAPDVTAVYSAPSIPLDALAAAQAGDVLELVPEEDVLAELQPTRRPAAGRRRRLALVAVALGALGVLAGVSLMRWAPGAARQPVAAAAPASVPAAPVPAPTLRAPQETFVAAPPGARAQPLVARGRVLSASEMALPLPAGREVAAAVRLLSAGDAEGALSRFDALGGRRAGSAEAWYGAAVALYALERDGEARVRLQRALEAQPEHAPSHLLLGFLEQQAAALAEARAHYERFLTAAPDGPLAEDVRELLAQLPE